MRSAAITPCDGKAWRYVAAAAALTVFAATAWWAAERVHAVTTALAALGDDSLPWVAAFWTRWDGPVSPAFSLKALVIIAVPALAWAIAIGAAVPRVAVRVAALLAQRWIVFVAALIAAGGVLFTGARVLGDRALDMDESSLAFQSKVFARGRLAAPALPGEEDVETAFVRAKTEVARDGRWFSIYPPLHPALLAAGRILGWPKLAAWLAALGTVFLTYDLGRRRFNLLTGNLAAVLVATSPFFLYVQGSYLSEATFLFFFALGLWAFERLQTDRGWKAPAFLALGAAGAFLIREYHALVLAVPLGAAYFAGNRRGEPKRAKWTAAVVVVAVGLGLWGVYNYAQTGNVFLPPRYFSSIKHVGFDAAYTWRTAATSLARNLYVLSTDGYGWPLLCLVPAAARLFLRPRPTVFEYTLYGVAAASVAANCVTRNAGIVYGARYYYAAWWALTFITANFIVILGMNLWGRMKAAAEGLGVLALLALVAINAAVYLPRATGRYAGRPWGNYSLWADAGVKAALARMSVTNAVVVLSPRDWCLTSYPGSPFLDDDVVFVRDAGERNAALGKLFPDKAVYYLDYRVFRETGEITLLLEKPVKPVPGR